MQLFLHKDRGQQTARLPSLHCVLELSLVVALWAAQFVYSVTWYQGVAIAASERQTFSTPAVLQPGIFSHIILENKDLL